MSTSTNQQPENKATNRRQRVVESLLVIGLLLLLFFLFTPPNCFAPHFDSKPRKTHVIIQTIRAGIDLGIANRGKITATFEGYCDAFRESSALSELASIKAIDQEHRCFVDGWGHPISITQNETGAFVVVSPGPDGILGNQDDVR